MAGEDKVKETTLSLKFRDNANELLNSLQGIITPMAQCLYELGCPDCQEVDSKADTYTLKWGARTLNTDDDEFVEFAQAICADLIVKQSKIKVNNFNSTANEDVIRGIMPDIHLELQNSFARTRIALIGDDYISISTHGNAPKSYIDTFHRKNVLAIKDKIIATSVVLNTNYTCNYKIMPDYDCKV